MTLGWTGRELFAWGGRLGHGGGMYDPSTDSWRPISEEGSPPLGRASASATWVDGRVLVWGGWATEGDSRVVTNDAFLYDPDVDAWEPLVASGSPPSPRADHSAVLLGDTLFIWGGRDYDSGSTVQPNGSLLDVESMTWRALPEAGAPPGGWWPSVVWTGSEVLVWGGYYRPFDVTGVGAAYDPETDSWRPLSSHGAPSPRAGHSTAWTGQEMIVWGGCGSSTSGCYSDGAAYNPQNDAWRSISAVDAPSPRGAQTAVWTGDSMIIWGGVDSPEYCATGAIYRPDSDSWEALSSPEWLVPRLGHSAFWTGEAMIVAGGDELHNGWSPGGAMLWP